MSDSDTSSYLTRYNLVTQSPEYFAGSNWYPITLNGLSATFPATAGVHSFQLVSADLTLEAASGSSSSGNPKFLAGGMFSLHGASLTATANYLGGVIGQYDIPGTLSTTYPAGAVLGMIADGTTAANGAFVAFIDGDSSQTKAGAAYTVRNNNSTAGSGFAYGVDLLGAAHDGYPAVAYTTAEIRLSNGIKITAPTATTVVFTSADDTKTATITLS